MSAILYQKKLVEKMSARMGEILQQRSNIPHEELEYVVEKTHKMHDERLKSAITGLIGWGDDERAELETFVAIGLELMKKVSPSRLQEATRIVEIRYHVKILEESPT